MTTVDHFAAHALWLEILVELSLVSVAMWWASDRWDFWS